MWYTFDIIILILQFFIDFWGEQYFLPTLKKPYGNSLMPYFEFQIFTRDASFLFRILAKVLYLRKKQTNKKKTSFLI